MHRASLVIVASAYLLAGCGSDTPGAPGGTGGSSNTESCPTGHVVGPDGGCMPVGIQGCAEMFIEDDGLCHPSMDKCPAGTIPQFTEGCVPVGIPGCPEVFIEEDGLCHPSTDKCAAGSIPKLDEGCVPVGIPGCAEVFIEEDGLCHPSMDKCPEGTFAVPTEGCAPVDGPDGCGSGTWGNIPDAPNTVWVNPGSLGGDGDGSKLKPFATIAAALAAVPSGGRVALAAGDYDEPVLVDKPLELVGRCPSLVKIGGTTVVSGTPAVVVVTSTKGVTLRGIHVEGDGVGLAVLGAEVELRQSAITGNSELGIWAKGEAASITVEHSLVADTRPSPGDKKFGLGLDVVDGASASVARSALAGNHGLGFRAMHPGTTVALDGCLVAGASQPSGELGGQGAQASLGASVVVSRSAIVDNHDVGLLAAGVGTKVTIEESVVADTQPLQGDQLHGNGVVAIDGASLALAQSALAKNHEVGLVAVDAGTTVMLEGSLVADTQPRPGDQLLGHGVQVASGASVAIVRSVLAHNHEAGLWAEDAGTTVTLDESVVADTEPRQDDELLGHGVVVDLGALAAIARSALVHNHEVGLWAVEAGTTVTLEDSLVADTRPRPGDQQGGRGVEVAVQASMTIARSALVRNHEVGLLAAGAGTTVTVEQCLVADTRPHPSDQEAGHGAGAAEGASLRVAESALAQNRELGLLATGAGTTVTVERSLVADTRPRPIDQQAGRGVQASAEARVTITSSALVGNHELGLWAGHEGTTVTVAQSLIADTQPRPGDQNGGSGCHVRAGASVAIAASALVRNHEVGLAATGTGTAATLEGSLIADTQPRSDGSYGVAVSCSAAAAITGAGLLLSGSRTAGLIVGSGCHASLQGSDVTGVLPGSFHRYDEDNEIVATYDGIADGVVVMDGSTATLSAVRVTGAARAGFVFDSCSGLLAGVSTQGARYGLVVQGEPKPDWSDPANLFDATELPILTDGALPVPGPPPIPEE